MPPYALKICEADLPLITFLNDGVEPKIEEEPTYFLFEIEGPTEITTRIVNRQELHQTRVIFSSNPLFISLEK